MQSFVSYIKKQKHKSTKRELQKYCNLKSTKKQQILQEIYKLQQSKSYEKDDTLLIVLNFHIQ